MEKVQSSLDSPNEVDSIESLIRGDSSIFHHCLVTDNKLSQIDIDFINDLESTGFTIDYVKTGNDELFYIVKGEP